MPKDFRAKQIRTTQIIASGGIPGQGSHSNIGLLIYSSSDASNLEGGLTHNLTASAGHDVWMFVSGSKGGRDAKLQNGRGGGVVLFGGDVVVSGTFYVDKMVVEVEESTTGSFSVSGSLFVSQSGYIRGGLVVNDDGGSDSNHDFRVESDGEDEALFVDSSANTFYINKGETAFETVISNVADEALRVDAEGVVINEDSHANIDFRVESNSEPKALFVDSGQDHVQIKASEIHLTGTLAGAGAIKLKTSNASGGIDIDAGTSGVLIDTTGLVSIDAVGATNLTTHGELLLSGSDKVTVESTEASSTAVVVKASHVAGGIDIDAGTGGIAVDTTGAVSIDAAGTSNLTTNGTLTVSGSTGLNLKVDNGTIDIETRIGSIDIDSAGTLTIDSAQAIAIGANADKPIDIDASTLDIDTSGAITIDSTSTFSIDGVGTSNITTHGNLALSGSDLVSIESDGGEIDLTARLGNIDINATAGNVTIDAGGTFSVDGVGGSNITTKGILTVSGSTKALLTSTAATALAVQLDASHAAGGVDIRAGTSGVNIATNASGVPVIIGHTTSETRVNDNLTVLGVTEVRGLLSASANLTVEGDVNVAEYIKHSGDTNTYIRFTDDDIELVAGGVSGIKIDEGGSIPGESEVAINDGSSAALDFRVATGGSTHALFIDSGGNTVGIGKPADSVTTIISNVNDEAIRVDATGVVFNEDGHATNDFRVESDTKENAIFVDAGSDQVLILSGGAVTSYNEAGAADVNFYVSGSSGTRGKAVKGTAVFGGDVHISGTITAGSGISAGTPGGSDGQVQYNNGGAFGGLAKLTWDDTNFLLGTSAATKLQFRDAGLFINSPADGHLDLVSDTRLTITGSGAVADAIALQNSNAAGGIDIDAGSKGITVDTTGIFYLTSSNNNANAIQLFASSGGLSLVAAGAAGEDIDIRNTNGSIQIVGGENQANAVRLHASNAAGGLDIDTGTGGVAIDSTGVISIDAVGTSNLTTKGALTVSGSAGLNLKADSGTLDIETRLGGIDIDAGGALTLDGSSIGIGTASDVAIDIDSSTLDIDASGAITIDGTSTFSVDAVGTSNITTNGALTVSGSTALNLASDGGEIDLTSRLGNIDINATAGNVTIDSGGTFSIDGVGSSNLTTKGALTVSGSAGLNLKADSVGIDIESRLGGIDVDAGGTLTLDSSTSIGIGTNADKPIDIDSSTLDIDASGAITIDGTSTFSIDGVGASNITTNGVLTVSGSTGLNLKADSGTIDIETRVGTIDIDSTGALTIDSAASVGVGTNSSGVAIGIGHTTSETTVNDNLSVTGDITISEYLYHGGDTNTFLRFKPDQVRLETGGNTNLKISTDAFLVLSGGSPASFHEAGAADVAFYVSGSVGSRGTATRGASIFGGDVHISGAITAGSGLGGSIDGSGASTRLAYWSDSDTLTSDADLNFNGSNLGVTGSASGANSALDIDRNYSATTSNSTAGGIAASGILIDYDVTGIVAASQTQRHKALWVKYDQSVPSHHASSIVQGTGLMVEMTGSTDGVQTIEGIYVKVENPGSLAADASRGICIDAPAGWVDGTANGSHIRCFNQADNADYFDISVGSNGSTQLTTLDNAAANAHLNLKPDGVLLIHSGGAVASFNEAGAADVNFYVSGSVGSRGTSTKGTSVFGGDVHISGSAGINTVTVTSDGKVGIGTNEPSYKLEVGGNMSVGEYIYHRGDTDTFIRFQADSMKVNVGNVDMISITEDGSQDKIVLNEGGSDVDFRVESSGEDEAILLDAGDNTLYINKGETAFTTIIGSTNDEAARFGATGAVFNEDGHATNDFRVESDNKDHAFFVDAGSDQVLILSGGAVSSYNEASGADVNFYASGSTGSRGTAVRGTAVFGGDVHISGTITAGGGISGAVSAVANGADNRVATFSSSDALNGEANLTFDGTDLGVSAKIFHVGDTDTFINFTDDDINITVGNVSMLDFNEGANDSIVFNEGGADVDFRVESDDNAHMLFINGNTNRLSIGTVGNSPETTVHMQDETPTLRIQRSDNSQNSTIEWAGAAGVRANMFHLGTDNDLIISSWNGSAVEESLRFAPITRQILFNSGSSNSPASPNEAAAADVSFYVSGTVDSSNSSTRGAALFGGDLVTSGAMYGKQLEYTYHCYNRGNDDQIFIGWYNNNEANSAIDDVQAVMPFAGRPVRVIVRPQNDLGSTTVGFHKAVDGNRNIATTPIESITNFSAADATSVAFDFTVTGSNIPTANFSAGDIVGISIKPTNNPGDVNVTCIWEFRTHRIISGSAI